jgi:hypothetical protein
MSKIPEAREKLLALSNELPLKQQRQLRLIVHNYLYREPRVRRAPVTSKKLTPKLRAKIKRIARDNPSMPIRKIGEAVGVDGGRVSEVLTGKR